MIEMQERPRHDLPRRVIFSLIFAAALAVFAAAGAIQAQNPAAPAASSQAQANANAWSPEALGEPLLRDPVWVYNDWSAYD